MNNRHNARAIRAAAAAAGVPSNEELKTKSLPKLVHSEASVKGSVLYVDVVKNMPLGKHATAEQPPEDSPPEFSFFREDFPALPGGRRASASSVPDDWTSMISDDEELVVNIPQTPNIASSPTEKTSEDDLVADEPKSVYSLISSAEEASLASEPEAEPNNCELKEESPKAALEERDSSSPLSSSFELNGYSSDYFPVSASRVPEPVASELLCEVSVIFSKQFMQEGVRQRAMKGSHRQLAPAAPGGGEGTKIRVSLKTHTTGFPVGGVNFERELPARNSAPHGAGMAGVYGLLGLAGRLGVAQDDPDIIPMIYGEDDLMSMGNHFPDASARNLYSAFAGPFQGFYCGLNDGSFNVPPTRQMASRLGLDQPKMSQMQEELLFFYFYNCPGDMLQMLSAAELADRNWRYHMSECLWLRRQADNPNYVYLGFQESGEYNFFNKLQWVIQRRYFYLDPDQIERTLSKEELFEKYGYHPQM
ncbi:uncharacterized protein LOC117584144 [Drosophila guanche]|uniref:Blast:Regulator of gene activity n=1 Tax=Drosophila guanche TaxID=7266 RepID=A0A3B0JHE6_DROGU|nr:uncharacterized protein LOC117584144 [Drosophila guanche]SPP81824.1 blast:Regulator of gene activity [Drosophila guanche]